MPRSSFRDRLRGIYRWFHARTSVVPVPGVLTGAKLRILALGVYLADRPNTVAHLVHALSSTQCLDVTQQWVAVGKGYTEPDVTAVTVERLGVFTPKFVILNRLLDRHDWKSFDFLLFCDDDIVVPKGFLEAFMSYQVWCDFALAQPARTRFSHADRKFVREMKNVRARRTRFVEIGPLVSMRADIAPLLLPFDEASPMGWGYDFVWPVIAEKAQLRLGVVDATTADHSLRPPAVAYDSTSAGQAMAAYLERNPHLTKQEAFTVLDRF